MMIKVDRDLMDLVPTIVHQCFMDAVAWWREAHQRTVPASSSLSRLHQQRGTTSRCGSAFPQVAAGDTAKLRASLGQPPCSSRPIQTERVLLGRRDMVSVRPEGQQQQEACSMERCCSGSGDGDSLSRRHRPITMITGSSGVPSIVIPRLQLHLLQHHQQSTSSSGETVPVYVPTPDSAGEDQSSDGGDRTTTHAGGETCPRAVAARLGGQDTTTSCSLRNVSSTLLIGTRRRSTADDALSCRSYLGRILERSHLPRLSLMSTSITVPDAFPESTSIIPDPKYLPPTTRRPPMQEDNTQPLHTGTDGRPSPNGEADSVPLLSARGIASTRLALASWHMMRLIATPSPSPSAEIFELAARRAVRPLKVLSITARSAWFAWCGAVNTFFGSVTSVVESAFYILACL